MVSGLVLGSCILVAGLISLGSSSRDSEIERLNQFLKRSNLKVEEKKKNTGFFDSEQKEETETHYAYCYGRNQDDRYDYFYISIPDQRGFKDLQNLQSALENHFKKVVSCEITDDFKYILKTLKDDYKKLEVMLPFKLIDVSETLECVFCVGKSLVGYEYINFSKVPNLLIAGATGWGKSFCIRSIVSQLIHNYKDSLELVLIDLKGGLELGCFSEIKQTEFFTFKPWACEGILNKTYDEIENRLDKFRDFNVKNISEFNQISEEKMKFKVVVIEEFTILMDYSKDIFNVLIKSLAISRATGIYFIFTSQRFDSKIIDSRIKANIDNRICFHTTDAINSKLILDEAMAENLNVKGRAILSSAGNKVEFQSFFLNESDVQEVVNANLKPRRTIKETSSNKKINNATHHSKAVRTDENEFGGMI